MHDDPSFLDYAASTVWALAALGRIARSGTLARMLEGWTSPTDPVEQADARLLEAFGMLETYDRADPAYFRVTQAAAGHSVLRSAAAASAFARTHLIQAGSHALGRGPGWNTDDPELLRAQGSASAVWADVLAEHLLPAMPGLAPTLTDDAAFLDVGVGVAALSVAMCRRYPGLRAVGLDVFTPALRIAREDVGTAGLNDRIELRTQSVAHLEDESCFDLAWLPQPFLAPDVMTAALPRVRTALRPGGWLIVVLHPATRPGVPGAFDDLLATVWGGGTVHVGRVTRNLTSAGFSEVAQVTVPLPASVVVARRPMD